VSRSSSALSVGMRPVRALFTESVQGSSTYWTCRLCSWLYHEANVSSGWPISVGGLFMLVKHLKGHQSQL
jgi:hypothetical protein